MRIALEIGDRGSVQRFAFLTVGQEELAAVYLHVAFPEKRNRTGLYMRRHPVNAPGPAPTGPNNPLRAPAEPPKLSIPQHLELMWQTGALPPARSAIRVGDDTFGTEPAMIAVPISDLAANLLRPCFHAAGLGGHRLFYLEEEPIALRSYWCACFFHRQVEGPRLELRQVRFDLDEDRALDPSGADLMAEGLVWAAALVPLVVDGRPLPAVEIARNDYDLRQILGRSAEGAICHAYAGWFGEWDARVRKIVADHEGAGQPFETFYHSVLAIDYAGDIHIRQLDATLPGLAVKLADEGMVGAGVLDSGGSCALYDVWMASYLNHSWYFREPRGSILVFELKSSQRLPLQRPGSWIQRRKAGLPAA